MKGNLPIVEKKYLGTYQANKSTWVTCQTHTCCMISVGEVQFGLVLAIIAQTRYQAVQFLAKILKPKQVLVETILISN
jgi:hypothetical protein